MSIQNDTAPLSTKSNRNRWDPLLDSEKHKFRVQNKPPLSLQQFFRSTISTNPRGKQWKPAGVYHITIIQESPPKASNDLPNIVVKSRENPRPAWFPPGTMKYKRPASPKDKNKSQKSEEIPIESRSNVKSKSIGESVIAWYPSGNPSYESVPYFDAPSLRWSQQQIKESMIELK